MKQLKAAICCYSSTGVKPENQDCCDYHNPIGLTLEYKGITSAIADGVSACDKAKEASNCCVKGFLSDYYSTPDSWNTRHSATKVISALNNWLHSQSIRLGEHSSMLSTLSILIIKSNVAHIFHVGDSRIYRLQNQCLTQLTHNHVLKVKQNKTYLSRVMGFDLNINVDYQTHVLKLGDVFLLTTDGVHDVLDLKTLETYLNQQDINSKTLVHKAISVGSKDNVSAMIVRIKQLPEKKIDEVFDQLSKRVVPPDLDQGMKIDGLKIKSLIKSSAKMQLYLAKDIDTGQLVALKTPSINFEDNPAYLQRFAYEEWVGKRIHSAYVCKIHHHNSDNKFLAYAMEYIDGQTLRQLMTDNTKLSVEVITSIVKQIIQGLRAFHRQEMLHCDLKPENIMINNIGQVKLVDFGSATIAGVAELINPIHVADNKGTQGYTAPEVILENSVSQESDQFSLGVVVYEMFTGKLPYQNKLNQSITPKKLEKLRYQSILTYDPLVPIWIDHAVAKACSLNKNNRYQALSEFLSNLQQPNLKFLQTTNVKQPEDILKKYRLFMAMSFMLNVFLLLMLTLFMQNS